MKIKISKTLSDSMTLWQEYVEEGDNDTWHCVSPSSNGPHLRTPEYMDNVTVSVAISGSYLCGIAIRILKSDAHTVISCVLWMVLLSPICNLAPLIPRTFCERFVICCWDSCTKRSASFLPSFLSRFLTTEWTTHWTWWERNYLQLHSWRHHRRCHCCCNAWMKAMCYCIIIIIIPYFLLELQRSYFTHEINASIFVPMRRPHSAQPLCVGACVKRNIKRVTSAQERNPS